MSYHRVIPRDLFNEASLLKCYGKLALWADDGVVPGLQYTYEGAAFVPMQDDSDGSLTLVSVVFYLGETVLRLHRPLNDRDSWSLYATDRDDNEACVFNDDGTPHADFIAMAEALAAT